MPFQPTYTLVPRILRQLKAIERTAGFLTAVRLQPDWIREVRNETHVQEALASVQIEGNSLTLEQAFELAQERPARELRDAEREFYNYLQAFEATEPLHGLRDAKLAKGDLLNLHRILVGGVRGGQRHAGRFRREDVEVGDLVDGRKTVWHRPPVWSQVEAQTDELFAWIEAGKHKIPAGGPGRLVDDPWVHPVIQAAIAQHRLVWIHPFVDGNGRSARMFTTLLLYQRGYDFKYLFTLSDYYNNDRDAYYAALRSADRGAGESGGGDCSGGDYTEWLVYFLGGLANQMVRIEERVKKRVGAGDVPNEISTESRT